MSPASGRRATDRADEAPASGASLFARVERFGPWLIPAAVWLVTQYSNLPGRVAALERGADANRQVDSVSVEDRRAQNAALSLIGRDRCLENRQRAVERGYPCAELLGGSGQWPLLHPLRAAASSGVIRPARSTPARPALALAAALLVPAVPRPE